MEFLVWYESLGEVWRGVLVGAIVLILFGLIVLYLIHVGNRSSRRIKKALKRFASKRGLRYIDIPLPNDIPALLIAHPEDVPQDAYRRRKEDMEAMESVQRSKEEAADFEKFIEIFRDFDFSQDLALYTRGDPGKLILATHFLKGTSGGANLYIFEYTYTGEYSDNDVSQTVLRFKDAKLNLPSFSIQSEGLWEKVKTTFTGEDIDFDSHPRFSKHFRLQGKDEAAVRALFAPDLLTYLESKAGICIDGAADELLVYRAGETVRPEDLDAFLKEGEDVLAHLLR